MSIRLEMTRGAERKIRYSEGAKALCEQHGHRVAATANSTLTFEKNGYRVDSRAGARVNNKGRWRVSVVALTPEAIDSNARHNTLLKALGRKG